MDEGPVTASEARERLEGRASVERRVVEDRNALYFAARLESIDARERLYCLTMMLDELKRRPWVGLDTRRHLSLDLNDEAVLRELLEREIARLTVSGRTSP